MYQNQPTMIQTGMQPHRGGLILTLAIIGLFFLGPILGTIALVMANGDLRAMDSGQMDPSGRGTTQAGRVLGIIDLVLWIFGLLGGVILMGFLSTHGTAIHR